jgi:predicted amidophosphoribosyltransferase
MESLYVYAGPVREAILDWKLRGRDAGVEWLLDTAAARLRDIFTLGDVLLPVPMPLTRMRRAGRHHAADLCRAIAHVTGARVEWRWLRRAEDAGRQSERGRGERWRHARRAFRLNEGADVELPDGGRLWVVDDIRTTGATLHWACKTLRPLARSAHADILAFSLARTPEAR